MKKMMISTLLALSACVVIAGCGMGGSVTEHTDPAELTSEKVSEEHWSLAFKPEENYCVKTVVTSTPTEKDATMSAITTINYCNDGDRVCLKLKAKMGDDTLMEAEAYAELGEEHTLWERSKMGDDDWSKWEVETYSSEQFSGFFGGYSVPSFVKDNFAYFEYSNEQKGYVATEEGMTAMGEALQEYVSKALAQTPAGGADATAENLVLKFTEGRPSAVLCDLTYGGAGAGRRMQSPERRIRIPRIPRPFPRIRFSHRNPLPRLLIDVIPAVDGPEELEPETPEIPAVKISVSQIYYNYGKARVTLPDGLPTPGGEE